MQCFASSNTALLADKEYHHTLEHALHSAMIMRVKESLLQEKISLNYR